MKYEIKFLRCSSDQSKIMDQTVGVYSDKKAAYRSIVHLAKVISGYQTIDYNCIELRKDRKSKVFGKLIIVEHLDKRTKKYGPFLDHLLVIGKSNAISK